MEIIAFRASRRIPMEDGARLPGQAREDAREARRPYTTPKLESYGFVWEVATAASGVGADAGGKTVA
jgi:hypothetical protein